MTRAVTSSANAASSVTSTGTGASLGGRSGASVAATRLIPRLQRVASEPFVHFTLLGALVFAGHRLLAPAPDVPTIEVSAPKQRELAKLFEQRLRRAPTDAERQQLVQRYVEDEALFREGLRLSLVRTDPALRAQLVARVRGMLQAELEPKPPTDAELQEFYSAHRSDYVSPETISYREYVIPSGPEANDDARRLLALLRRQGGADAEGVPRPSEYSSYSEAQLVPLYGREPAHELWALPSGSWQELRSSRGIHLVRIDARSPEVEPSFITLRERVLADYRKDRTAHAFQAEVGRLTSQWRVQVAGTP